MPGLPFNNPHWASDLADVVERYVGKVRLVATDNAVKVSRAIVFGVLILMAVMVAVPLTIILVLGILRELLGFFMPHARAVYVSYYILGVALLVGGFVALRQRHKGASA
jgi:uncharacterized membrane protein